MSLIPLTITHAGGTRELELYRVDERSRSYATRFEVVKTTPRRARVIGDRLENPSTLQLTAYVQEASLASSYALGNTIIDECESASEVEYHEGVQLVSGIVSAGLRVDGLGVLIALEFAPTKPEFEVVP